MVSPGACIHSVSPRGGRACSSSRTRRCTATSLPTLQRLALAFAVWATSAASAVAAEDGPAPGITVRIEKPVVEAFCDAVFPMTLAGTKKVGVTILGNTIAQDVPWKATVRSPEISIDADAQTFVAQVEAATTGGPPITWEGEVTGRLTVEYVEKTQTVLVRVKDAVAPVALGPIRLDLDVSQDVPELTFQMPVPTIQLPDQKKKGVRVSMKADIEFVEDAIVVAVDPAFEGVTITRARPPRQDPGRDN